MVIDKGVVFFQVFCAPLINCHERGQSKGVDLGVGHAFRMSWFAIL